MPMIKQPTPPKKQTRKTSVSIKAIDFKTGSIPRAASESGRGTRILRTIKAIPTGRSTDFFETFGAGYGSDWLFIGDDGEQDKTGPTRTRPLFRD
jgi:hypothetical protein